MVEVYISVKQEVDDVDVSACGSNSQRLMAVPGQPFDVRAVVQQQLDHIDVTVKARDV